MMKTPGVTGGVNLKAAVGVLRKTHHLNAGVVPRQILPPNRCFHQHSDSFGHFIGAGAAPGGRS
jgi:hypothetical protein